MKRGRLGDRVALGWLLAGGIGLAFGQGHAPIGVAALVGAICMVRFFRASSALPAFIGFVVAHVLVWETAYRGMVPLPWGARLGMETGVSVLLAFVFLLDRWATRRSRSLLTTLVLPCGWVAFEFLSARLSPGGTWGSVAYSFVDDLVVAQAASLFGWVTITFLVAWIASAVNRAWDLGAPAWQRGLVGVGLVVVAVLAYGTVRLLPADQADTARVACIVAPSTFDDEHINDVWAYTRGVEAPAESTERAIARIEASIDEHFALAEHAAATGARMVLWPEAGVTLTSAEETRLIARAGEVARAHDLYLGLGLFIFRPETREPSINKFVLVEPSGVIAIDFIKATRPPGAGHVVGDGVLPLLESPLGAVSTAICFDLDFPHLVGQAGRTGADLFLAPSNDWSEARATHARMARMRSIEQGFALVRPTRDGVTIFTDGKGRVLASLTLDDRQTGTLVADVPTRGHRTLYAAIGDAFSWACSVALVAVCVFLRRR
ncbi:MAG: hypothetical protein HKN62_02335 [Phycisphaerales bacterium]|nr:hypothetical protein [Phycisphaerales bacterium]